MSHSRGSRPRHQAGERLRLPVGPVLPDARVRLSDDLDGLAGEPLDHLEGLPGGELLPEPLVEEQRGERQDHLAVDVVLAVERGSVADPDRLLALETRPVGEGALVQIGLAVDPVQGGELEPRAARDDVEQVLHEALALLEVAQPPEGVEGVVGIAEPAIAVVPGAPGPRRLGEGGGRRGHDRAGVLEAVQLEREGRADDLALVDRRHVAVLDPALPVADRLVEVALTVTRQRLVDEGAPGQDEVLLRRQGEGNSVEVRQGHVRGQQQRDREAFVAEVVGPLDAARRAARPAQGRLAADDDAGLALQRLEHPHDLRGPHRSVVVQEARREVDDAEPAVGGREDRLEDVGVREVALAARARLDGAHLEAPAAGLVQQRREDRLGVESREATPADVSPVRDERRELAVADETEILEPHGSASYRRFDARASSRYFEGVSHRETRGAP